MLSRAVSSIFDGAMRHHGFTIPQMNLIVCVAAFDEIRPSKVAQILHMDHTTISRNLDRLIQKGWIEQVADADGRAKPIRVTSKGRKVMEKALPDWRKAQKEAEEFLGEAMTAAIDERISMIWHSQ